jgi:iron complex transport system ATP-binding protein
MIAISLKNVTFSYPDEKPIFDNLSLRLFGNQVITLLGPNGSGKSTFIKLCMGFLSPTKGDIVFNGDIPLKKLPVHQIGNYVAYVPQSESFPYHLSVSDYVLLGRTPKNRLVQMPTASDKAVVKDILLKIGIDRFTDRSLHELSGGEQQLAAFARALAQQVPFLFLDEIAAELDLKNTLRVLRLIRDLTTDHTVIFSTHDPQIAEAISDSVILFSPNNLVVIGQPKELLTSQMLTQLYEIPSGIIRENPIQINWLKHK